MVNGLQKLSETEQTDGCLVDGHFARVRTPTQRTPEKIAEVSDIIRSNPSASTRKVAQEASVSHTVAWKILREDLGVFPYKIQLGQPLPHNAPARRYKFANELIERIEKEEIDKKRFGLVMNAISGSEDM